MGGSVDVVLLTKDSQRVLAQCVESIYRNVPLRQLIVVDGFSKDKTLEILENFQAIYGNVKVVFDKGTRATARQRGIEEVKTDWFMFVDSDVVLCRDWYKKAQKYMQPGVGAIWGTEVWSTIKNHKILKLFLITTRKIFDVRGGTHDTLVKTDAIKEIAIPKELHVFEDAYIKDWITKKGYSMVACYSPFCIHYRPQTVWTLSGSLGLVAESLRLGNALLVSRLLLAYGFYTAYSIYQLLAS